MMDSKALIFDIKRYAIHDGPGIRLTVHLKGCNLACAWCHNPEGVSPRPEKLYSKSRCIGCGTCVEACPEAALTLGSDGIVTDTERCTLCGTCAEVCPTKAFEMSGQQVTAGELLGMIEQERPFFGQSGGGVTFSGGEPLLQHDFLLNILEECGRRGIHRTVDTAGNVRQETLLAIARHTDLFLFDLKHMDSGEHRRWTGAGNERILENLRALAAAGAAVWIRVPLIGGVNDDEENIRATGRFLRSLPGTVPPVQLVPYHSIARPKYARLGREEDFVLMEEPSAEILNATVELLRQEGVTATVGG